MSYLIIKIIDQGENKPPYKVVLLKEISAHTEVWEFDTEEEANEIAKTLQLNSDSGHKYEVKKIGS